MNYVRKEKTPKNANASSWLCRPMVKQAYRVMKPVPRTVSILRAISERNTKTLPNLGEAYFTRKGLSVRIEP